MVGEHQKLRHAVGQGKEDIKALAAADAGAVDIHDIKGEADGERAVENEIERVQQILPEDHAGGGDLLQEAPAHRGGRGKEIAQQQEQEHKVLVLQLGGEAAAHLVLTALDRQRIDEADQGQDKGRNLKTDFIHAFHAFRSTPHPRANFHCIILTESFFLCKPNIRPIMAIAGTARGMHSRFLCFGAVGLAFGKAGE